MAGLPEIDVQLVDRPIEYLPVAEPTDSAGGECVFLGRTRLETHPLHGPLRRLNYQAYPPMAERILRDLASAAIERYGCTFVRIHHALCDVAPGQASVLVQVTCPHRAEAFDACRFLIDRLKREAPIWKREEWSRGATWSDGAPAATQLNVP